MMVVKKQKYRIINSWMKKGMAAFICICLSTVLLPAAGNLKEVQAAGTAQVRNINLKQNNGEIAGIHDPGEPTGKYTLWGNKEGSYVYFGNYFQSDTSGTEKEPVKWRVLDAVTTDYNANSTMLLWTDMILDQVKFNEKYGDGKDYAGSNIRKWLNSEPNMAGNYTAGGFLDTAFTAPEQTAIAVSTKTPVEGVFGNINLSKDNSGLSQNGTQDKIFLLSALDANNIKYGFLTSTENNYTRSSSARLAYTAYADRDQNMKNTYSPPYAPCYLRSASTHSSGAVGSIEYDGSISYTRGIDDNSIGTAPAFNLDLSSVVLTSASGTDKSAPFTVTVDDSKSSTWNVTLSGGTGFSAVRKDGDTGNVSPGKALMVNVTDIGNTTSGDIVYTQLSAMLVDEDGTVAAYGKVKDTAESGEVAITIPAGIAIGDYTLKVFAEDVNSSSALNLTDYSSNMSEITVTVGKPAISAVEVTDIDLPAAGQPLDMSAACATEGVNITSVSYDATPSVAAYNTVYTITVKMSAADGYEFPAGGAAVTINGDSAGLIIEEASADSLTISYPFPATAKAKLISVSAPAAINGLANGTAETAEALGLPKQVTIETEDPGVTQADVSWDLANLADGTSYAPEIVEEQTFKVNGTVTIPDGIDENGVGLAVQITVTVAGADFTGVPIADPPAGTYTQSQNVTLTSGTDGAEIYYTTDGSEPDVQNGINYTEPIEVTGIPGQSVSVTIKAMAVKTGLQNSATAEFSYIINIPKPLYTAIVHDGDGSGEYEEGESVTITAGTAPSGYRFTGWTVNSQNVTLADASSPVTTFIMPAEAVEITADYVPFVYNIIQGADSTWTKGSTEGLIIASDADFSIFTGINIDGAQLEGAKYEAKSGSTVITLKPEFLQTLSTGKHDIQIMSADGNAQTTFTVTESPYNPPKPKPVYAVVVHNGEGSNDYEEGASVTITAGTSPLGQRFTGWTVNSQNVTLEDASSSVTTFIMPAEAVEITADYAPFAYNIIRGADSTWTKGSAKGLIIASDADFSIFTSISIDGAQLDGANYEAKSGSTVITLKPEFLQTLSVGKHEIQIMSADGKAQTTFTVKKASEASSEKPVDKSTKPLNKEKAVKTGDTAPITGILFLLLVSAFFCFFVILRKRIFRHRYE